MLRKKLLWASWLIAFALGVVGVYQRLAYGHTLAAYGSYVTWGLWVAAYIYFIGLSAGAFLLSSLVYVFNLKRLEKIGKFSLLAALVTLFMALLSIWFDLGHMGRFYRVFASPNFRSMMTWMVWLYTAYFLLLAIEIWFAMRADLAKLSHRGDLKGKIARALLLGKGNLTAEALERDAKILRLLGSLGVPLAVAFHGGVGALFATVAAKPYWHSAIYPIMFLTGALVSGGALITAAVAFFWPTRDKEHEELVSYLGKIVLGLLVFDLILEWAEFSIPMWYGFGHEIENLKVVLAGPFWWVFWILHLGLGSILPIALILSRPRNVRLIGMAAALIAVLFMSVRLNIVIPGLVVPELKGLESAFADHRLMFYYVPSVHEWLVLLFVVALGVAILYAGYKFLPIIEAEGVKR